MGDSEGINKICVFCGSRSGSDPLYSQKAKELGEEMVTRGIGLVYGGWLAPFVVSVMCLILFCRWYCRTYGRDL